MKAGGAHRWGECSWIGEKLITMNRPLWYTPRSYFSVSNRPKHACFWTGRSHTLGSTKCCTIEISARNGTGDLHQSLCELSQMQHNSLSLAEKNLRFHSAFVFVVAFLICHLLGSDSHPYSWWGFLFEAVCENAAPFEGIDASIRHFMWKSFQSSSKIMTAGKTLHVHNFLLSDQACICLVAYCIGRYFTGFLLYSGKVERQTISLSAAPWKVYKLTWKPMERRI